MLQKARLQEDKDNGCSSRLQESCHEENLNLIGEGDSAIYSTVLEENMR